jgi:hypothetical protein
MKQLKERGFENPSNSVLSFLQERQYQVGKAILLELEQSGASPITEELVVETAEKLFSRRNIYSLSEKEQMAAANVQPLPEIKGLTGPPIEKQLKQGSKSHEAKKSANSEDISGAPKLSINEDTGPTDETVFANRMSEKPIQFKVQQATEDETNKRVKN